MGFSEPSTVFCGGFSGVWRGLPLYRAPWHARRHLRFCRLLIFLICEDSPCTWLHDDLESCRFGKMLGKNSRNPKLMLKVWIMNPSQKTLFFFVLFLFFLRCFFPSLDFVFTLQKCQLPKINFEKYGAPPFLPVSPAGNRRPLLRNQFFQGKTWGE